MNYNVDIVAVELTRFKHVCEARFNQYHDLEFPLKELPCDIRLNMKMKCLF